MIISGFVFTDLTVENSGDKFPARCTVVRVGSTAALRRESASLRLLEENIRVILSLMLNPNKLFLEARCTWLYNLKNEAARHPADHMWLRHRHGHTAISTGRIISNL